VFLRLFFGRLGRGGMLISESPVIRSSSKTGPGPERFHGAGGLNHRFEPMGPPTVESCTLSGSTRTGTFEVKTMRKALLVLALSSLALSNTACEPGLAWGDPQAVIVVSPQDWWPQLEDSVYAVLSPTVWTVREDYTFRVVWRAPDDTNSWWRFRELVLIGSQEDGWLAEALATLPDSVTPTAPGIYETQDVWARGQTVNILLVDPNQPIDEQVFSRIGAIHQRILNRFLRGAENRMFLSGRDSALIDTLQAQAGFGLLLPDVYTWGREDSVYVFRNDNPDPSELIRNFTVTWRTPAPTDMPVDSLLDWRKAISEAYWTYPQVVDRDNLRVGPLPDGGQGTEVRGAWSNPPGSMWPAAGAFILRSVICPHQDRMYFLDGWLYAPGKDKWEYMLQMETILDSFRCGRGGS